MKSIIAIPLFLILLLTATAKDRPNFLLILLDDAGWTDFGCYGSRIQTPHIDRLAAEGIRFTDCHAAATNCSPARAGLLTGRIPARTGVYSYLPRNHFMHLRDKEITVAEILREQGYRTGHFGKWHLSRLESEQPAPADQGFEYSLGTDNNAAPSHLDPVNFVRNGRPTGKIEGYSCQIVVEETAEWLQRIQRETPEKPFFACVWFHEPHTPIASPPELVEKYRRLFPELNRKQATYHANIENVDRAVGKLMTQLKSSDALDRTVVFLTSDNGPLNQFSRQGLKGQKSNIWEGGHRVPGIFRWPGAITSGSQSAVTISGVDYLPTVCEIAGIDPPRNRKLDGASILPLLKGEPERFRRTQPLYWFFYRVNPSLALRSDQWVLIADTDDAQRSKTHQLKREDLPRIRNSVPTNYRLFNLADDLAQQFDLASERPELTRQLGASLTRLHAGVLKEGTAWSLPDNSVR